MHPGALTLNEGGATLRYRVVLLTEPTGTVKIQVAPHVFPVTDPPVDVSPSVMERMIVEPRLLTFTRGAWNVPQEVRITAPEDDVDHAEVRLSLGHDASGGGYDDEEARVSVRLRDNDTRGVTLKPRALEIVQGAWQSYTVVLDSEPTVTVDITVVSTIADVTPSPTTLTFTPKNWSSPQAVRVNAATNAVEGEGNLTHSVPPGTYDTTPDPNDNWREQPTFNIKSREDEGVAVNPTKLEITEGGSESYTVVLTKKPEKTVTVRVSEPTGDVRLNKRSLSFSTNNWNTPQSVRVSLAEDEDASDDPVVNLEHTITSEDSAYRDIPVADIAGVEVTPKDDDAYGITVTPTSLTVPAGSSGTYGVKLDSEPTATVRVEVMAAPEDIVTVSGTPLIFTTSNWRTAQTVTVAVDEDAGG